MDEELELLEAEDAHSDPNDEGAAEADIEGAAGDHESAERRMLERYRTALLASEPAIPAELVRGETADAIEASFNTAKELIARIRDELAAAAPQPVPAGAPGRLRAAPMTAFEKIRQGLGSQRG